MAEEHAKSEIEQVEDALAQLKEMHHYSKSNVETLSTQWILFDGELARLKKSEVFGALMDRQGQLHDALEAAIDDLEKTLEKMQPEEPDE